MPMSRKCVDGTIILDNEDEINGLLSNGWRIVEKGIASFESEPKNSNPALMFIAYRLHQNGAKDFYKLPWKEIIERGSSIMTFSSVETVQEIIVCIKSTQSIKEKEQLVSDGWILLKECRVNSKSIGAVYSFGRVEG